VEDRQKTAKTANPDDPPSGLQEAGKSRPVVEVAEDRQKTTITANPDDPPPGREAAGKSRPVVTQAVHL
jgi:hypothetical protein